MFFLRIFKVKILKFIKKESLKGNKDLKDPKNLKGYTRRMIIIKKNY